MRADEIKYIENEIEYVLLRPGIYVGSTEKNQKDTYILVDGKFQKQTIEYIPAFEKMIDELLSNSVDEAIKTNFKYGNKIEVITDVSGKISIVDNGRGISSSVEPTTQLPQAVVALTKLKAGSNFSKESASIGQNGVGASLVNIFSKSFEVETSDGIKKTTIHCSDNLSKMTFSQRSSKHQGTKITYLPDYPRLNMEGLNSAHLSLIEKRILNLSLCYPEITFSFNGNKIPKMNLKSYTQLFGESGTVFQDTTDNLDIAIVPFQESSELISFVNGIDTSKHGQHLTVFNRLFEKALKETKKTQDIPLNQFLNNCRVFILLKNVNNPSFSSQIKDELTNSYADVKKYFDGLSFDKMIASMMRNKEFSSYIQEYNSTMQRLKERKDLAKDEKQLKKHKVAKFLAPISSRTEFCNFYICEGDSAFAQLINVRNNFTAGYPLRGKVINPRTASAKKLLDNENMKDLIALLGLRLSEPSIEGFKWKSICILTDADNDGTGICAQLLNIFYTYWPDLINKGKVFRVMSPLIIAKHKTTKVKDVFYSLKDFVKKQEEYDILEYNKGLGSLDKEEYRKLVDNPVLIKFSDLETTERTLDKVFGKCNQDERKDWLLEESEGD
jgi:DNA gyrase/topoisomerase IV subunit B